jgi:hypothetical protein
MGPVIFPLNILNLYFVKGVAFMVAFLFLFMVALERLWERTETYYHNHFGKHQDQVM